MFSIGEFSFLCQLSPQTLRFYHSERLLVPAEVDEQNGYRSYTLDQVEQAMLIAVLRSTGMSIKLVRQAVDEPDAAPLLLQQHIAELQRRRMTQDEAIGDAWEFLTSRPEPREVHAAETTVVSKQVPGVAGGSTAYDWAADDAAFAATAQELIQAVEASGAVVAGAPWRTWAGHSPTPEGPIWSLMVPITADEQAAAALPEDVELQTFPARDELAIFLPGRSSTAKFGTALSRLLAHHLDDAVIDISRLRQILHADGVETTVAIERPNEVTRNDLEERFPDLTARAHAVLALAIDHARAQSSGTVGTGHLLRGIIDEGSNVTVHLLQAIPVDPSRIQRDVAQHGATEAAGSEEGTSPQFSTAATRALELAMTEATSLGSAYVGCEHLLLGLLTEDDGVAGQVLRASGARVRSTRRALTTAWPAR